MTILVVILHVIVCFALIIVVLLQSGKGAEMGASFGASGSQSVFGAGGGNTFMSKLTTSAAIIFMLTSLVLAYLSGQGGGGGSIMSRTAPKAKPAPMGGMPLQKPAAPQAPGAPGAVPAKPTTAPVQPTSMPAQPAPAAK